MHKDIDLYLVEQFLKDEFNNNIPNLKLYKGISSNNYINDYLLFEKNNSNIRKSKTLKEHGNIYNLLLNNLDCWKKYPLREKSEIVTNNLETAKSFANDINNTNSKVFRVIPKKNSDLVICPKSDIWYSFIIGLAEIGLRNNNSNLTKFNNVINEIFSLFDLNDCDKSWENLISCFNKVKNNNTKKIISFESNIVLQRIKSKANIISYLNSIFDPDLNNFKKLIYNNKLNISDVNNEIWFNSDAILINIDLENKLLK